jgi:acetamidase/formamidase
MYGSVIGRVSCGLAPLALLLSACSPGQPPQEMEGVAESGLAAAAVPAPGYTLDSQNTHARFSSEIPPVLTVPSGAVVEVFTKEATDGQLDVNSTAEDLATLSFDPIHPLTGPVFVEGARPGDVLAVTLHEIEVGDWGWTGVFPGFGFLPEDFPDPYLKTYVIEPGATEVVFNERIRIPLAPFAGVMGVAPATAEMLTTIPPRANGGNMDNRHLTVGTTVYFPVFVEGALFSIGDTHAAQGDGEVAGSAIEAPMRIVYQVEVIQGGRAIQEPQYETEEFYAVTGFAPTIDEAARKATRYMIDYLEAEHGLTRVDAYALASLVGDLKISETVDVPNMLVSMHVPKSVLGIR